MKIAISPCPNDTFIFYALINKKIDTCDIDFDFYFHDIEHLNRASTCQEYDIIKISYAHYAAVSSVYQLLSSGGAVGFGNGPLLVSRRKIYPDEVPHVRIATPGFATTANMLLKMAYPTVYNLKEYLFSQIEDVVLSDVADAGLLIHENRFTYHQRGLHKIQDLGQYWESTYNLPLPLGGIAIKRSCQYMYDKIDATIKASVLYAMQNSHEAIRFALSHTEKMDYEVCRQHIELYVNEFSIELGNLGKRAVSDFFVAGGFKNICEPVFK